MSGVIYPRESVYNLLPREEVRVEKPPRYTSKFRPQVVLEKKLSKDAMKTMGPAKVAAPSPEKYLKKHSGEPKLPEKDRCSTGVYKTCTAKRPPVPARTDRPLMGIHAERDFVKTAACTATPMRPPPTHVDTNRGHRELLENSGLVPKYIKKKDYGEVPEYLQQRAEEKRRAQEEYDNFVKEQREKVAMQCLSEEERRDTLERLKGTLDKLHREYQGLSFVTDTFMKRSRKERLEAAMRQLERDISRIEKLKTIYIANN